MKTLFKKLARVYNTPPLAFVPLECVKKTPRGDCSEVVQILVLNRVNGRLTVRVYPGVTGHESYYASDARTRLEQDRSEFVSEAGVFGPTKWKHGKFYFCAGSDVYAGLWSSNGEVLEAIEHMTKDVKDWTEA